MQAMIDSAEMQRLTQLACLELAPEESERLRSDLNQMLSYFEQLQRVDTAGVSEMQRPVTLLNVMREDEVGSMLPASALDALCPEMQGGFVRVPRTVEVEE